MLRRLESKKMWMMMLVVSVLVLGMLTNGYAKKEGIDPSEERLSGPAIVGQLTATLTEGVVNVVNVSISGNCKGDIPIILSDSFPESVLGKPFAQMTATDLEDIRIDTTVPTSCFSAGTAQLIINTVTKFTNSGQEGLAEAILLFVVTK